MMISREVLLDLFDHMECADAAIWTAVLADEGARADALVRGYLLHMHTVQRAFLNAWTNQPVAFRQTFDDTTLLAEFDDVRSYYAPARGYISAVHEAALGERIVLPWEQWVEQYLKRPPSPTQLGETILQAIWHTTHHRAQVSARLRALGGEPPPVDYIAWLWMGRPQPQWPAAAV